ncbi:MAG: Na/Pi cotransporter family protein [Candidatus Omnitrophica bacterium]|nr:Na/Pi cotransporter family protein [Candidatus Omnitrophota bacterium]
MNKLLLPFFVEVEEIICYIQAVFVQAVFGFPINIIKTYWRKLMSNDLLFGVIGGLGLFFYGMQIMSEGLKDIAGDRLKKILHMATRIPIIGILVGAVVTCLIQSSSATTVMVVGFVNAGLLTLKQSISVVIGANIGTTFTAWLVSSMSVFKVTHYAIPSVGIGFALMKLGRTKNARFWGQVIMGFGLLFMGLAFLKDAFEPLKNSQHVKDIFVTFSNEPLLGVLVGLVFTVILQSSSATIAIVQVLAYNGIISFPSAIPIILGDNIGTTITAQLAAIGANINARRTAMAHTLFNVIGVSYMLIFVYTGLFVKAVYFIVPGELTAKNIMLYIAVAHSFFNVINAMVFLPLTGLLEKVSIMLVPKRKDAIDPGPKFLERHLLDTPPIAMEQAKKETFRMLRLASMAVTGAMTGLIENDKKHLKSLEEIETTVDNLQSEITQYLVELAQRHLLYDESEELPVLLHSVNDIERIGDHSENIRELVEKKMDEKLELTDDATQGLIRMWEELKAMMDETLTAFDNGSISLAAKILKREQKINKFQIELKNGHIERLNKGGCNMKSGIVFLELVDNLEKIADHLTNIAEAISSGMKWRIVLDKN